MEPFNVIAILITLSAFFSFIIQRFIKIPMSIGLMLLSLATSILLILLSHSGIPIKPFTDRLVSSIDFNKVLMEGMLGFLLFAGALHVNLNDLAPKKLEIGIFASMGVLTSTIIVGCAIFVLAQGFGYPLRFIECLLFGALISPTDPIAVLSIMKTSGAPKSIETMIAGESLFNDGVGVVVFLLLLETATGHIELSAKRILMLFTQEALGGVCFGLFEGYLTYALLKRINHYQSEILLTLGLVTGGYALASALHLSGPIAIVTAGLLIGNQGRTFAMSDITRDHLDNFWELIDEILNALLFVLIGLEVLVLTLNTRYLLAGCFAVLVALAARFISIGVPVWTLRRRRQFAPGTIRIMTWCGLRGGISVALALSLPSELHRELLLTMTYVVVAFSILVQGLTVKKLL
ncbi:MAG: sodium:proton antiporter [Desulfobacteraceae bacterium]|nr:MAG: sodium:proton antiporter [Desulfobacteraceae bacterium]